VMFYGRHDANNNSDERKKLLGLAARFDLCGFAIVYSRENFREWCRLQESNPRPTVYKTVALPTELSRQNQDSTNFFAFGLGIVAVEAARITPNRRPTGWN
jgi:hypothetical protein